MKKVYIIIPTLNPKDSFIDYIKKLIEHGFENILVVNDGSRDEFTQIFEKINQFEECEVFNHKINLGKGRALKNAFNHFLSKKKLDEFVGVITVDSDGQHTCEDVVRLAELMSQDENKHSLFLGVRNFDKQFVPWKSRLGNKLTTKIMKFFYGKEISDTQTGLRGIPNSVLEYYLDLSGERFEYETNMLIETIKKNIKIVELPIETVYIDDNSETHFRAVQDSLLIYLLILKSFLKFSLVSFFSFVLDNGSFAAFLLLFSSIDNSITQIMVATIGARILSSLFNFYMNKNIVFENKASYKNTVVKYYLLCSGQMVVSGLLVSSIYVLTNIEAVILKILVDICLFFVSYQIQRKYIFK